MKPIILQFKYSFAIIIIFLSTVQLYSQNKFNVGDMVQANETVNVRSTPGGAYLGSHSLGDQGTILGGPTYALYSGIYYYWYQVSWSSIPTSGWSIQDGLDKIASTSTGNISFTIKNIDGTSIPLPGGNGEAKLYNSTYSQLLSVAYTNGSGVATFPSQAYGTYNIEAWHLPNPATIFGNEFWGATVVNNNSSNTPVNFTRNMPYSTLTKVYINSTNVDVTGGNVTAGTQLRIEQTITNPNVASLYVEGRIVLSRNENTPYDYDQTSSITSVNAYNTVKCTFLYTPVSTGSYYCADGTLTNASGSSYEVTDGAYWFTNPLFTVATSPVANICTINFIPNGPTENLYTIPDNGTGYIYFNMFSEGQPITSSNIFTITLKDQENQTYQATGSFIKPGILRIAIPSSSLTNLRTGSNTMTIQDSMQIGSTLFILSNTPPTFNIEIVSQSYNRTFDFFANGSAGINGSVGSIGLGPSISMAKLSISGTDGLGLSITADPNSNLILSRRFESGISDQLEVPSINTVIGNVSTGLGIGFSDKSIESQDISLLGIPNITSDQVSMAQAGFVLETLSMGFGNFSPTLGIFLNAIKQTLLSSSGIASTLNSALIKTSWGLGVEGTINAGFNADFGSVKINLANASITGVLSGSINNYPKGLQSIVNATNSTSLSAAINFDFSLLNFSFANQDGVSLGSSNLGLFDVGEGMETDAEAFFNNGNQFQQLNLTLKGGGSLAILSNSWQTYFESEVDIPGEYLNILEKNNFAINGLISNNSNIELENLIYDIPAIIDTLSNNFIQTPLSITTYENDELGLHIPLDIDIDAALGVGLGIKLGMDLTYSDEISFPKKYTLLYPNNNNYLMYSSNYSNQMSSYNLSNYLTSLINGTASIIKTSFTNFMASANKLVQSNESFIVNGINQEGKVIGSIDGDLFQSGQWFVTTFSPNYPNVMNKSFKEPVVKNSYHSTKILHKGLSKSQTVMSAAKINKISISLKKNQTVLNSVQTTMEAISDNMKISFIPAGQSTSIDSVDNTFTIKMVIDTAKLSANGFTLADIPRIKIYRYDDSTGNWISEGGTLNGDTIEAMVNYMSNYLLGIELTNADDNTPPSILSYGPNPDSTFTSFPMIFAKIQDNQYGVGVNWAKTYLIANGDTLNASYDPTDQMIFYNLSSKDSLKGTINVTVWTSDYNGNNDSIKFSFNLNITAIKEAKNNINSFKLLQNYPNPFNPTTIISYSVAKESEVKIMIFNAIGQYITTIVRVKQSTGNYSINFSGKRLASGIYFYSFSAIPDDGSAEYKETRKMILLK
jgi:hypothetical protein